VAKYIAVVEFTMQRPADVSRLPEGRIKAVLSIGVEDTDISYRITHFQENFGDGPATIAEFFEQLAAEPPGIFGGSAAEKEKGK
jgi:hypothetical protein